MNKQEIFDVVVQVVREVLPDLEMHDFEASDRLVDLGADSVDRQRL